MRALLAVAATILVLVAVGPAAEAAPPAWYPPLRWLPASEDNYAAGRAAPVSLIVIHATDGPYAGTLAWFRARGAKLSAHYVIRASDGEITQMVAEADTAFHARGWNQRTIGIEHEFDARRGISFTDAQYRSSAALVCAVARRYGIPADRAHIVGHGELPNADHPDPGPSWDWAYYMRLVNGCAGGAAASASSAATCDRAGCVPRAGLAIGARGADVQLLQWDLVYLGWMPATQAVLGEQRFGPLTDAAVRAYQRSKGLPPTGYYGPLTAAALARSLAGAPPPVSPATLAPGASSTEVARLQRDLGRLGYMTGVTGYFGPVTEAALRRFQSDRGIDATGTYGPVTRAALAVALP